MPGFVDPAVLLAQLVDALIAAEGAEPPAALLVQQNARDATLLVDGEALVLLAWSAGALPGAGVTPHLEAALASEREAVRGGLRGELVTVVLVGLDAPLARFAAELPRVHPTLVTKLAYARVPLEAAVAGAAPPGDAAEVGVAAPACEGEEEVPTAVVAHLEAALARVRRGAIPKVSREARAASERAGEHVLGAVGAYEARSDAVGWAWPVLAAQAVVLVAWWIFGWSDAALTRMGSGWGVAIRAGEWWRPFCASYLHAGVVHFLSNAFATLLFGVPVASALGASRAFVLFQASAVGGFLFATALRPDEDGVGASGGVFGLMVAALVLSLRRAELVPRARRKRLAGYAAVYLVLNVFGSLQPGVSGLGHAGGALVGLLLVGLRVVTVGLPELDSGREERPVFVALFRGLTAALALTVAASFATALWRDRPWVVRWPDAGERVRLTGAAFAIDVPHALTETASSWEESHRWQLGTLRRDPVYASIILRPRRAELPEDAAEARDALLVHFQERGAGEDLTFRQPPSAVEVEGRPFVFLDQAAKRDAELLFPRWVGVDGDVEVDLEVGIAESASDAWRRIAMGLVASVRRTE